MDKLEKFTDSKLVEIAQSTKSTVVVGLILAGVFMLGWMSHAHFGHAMYDMVHGQDVHGE